MNRLIDVKISNRIIALVLCIALLLPCLSACDDKDKDNEETKVTTSQGASSNESEKSTEKDKDSGTSSKNESSGSGSSGSASGNHSSSSNKKTTTRRSSTTTRRESTSKSSTVATQAPPVANAPYASPVIYSTVASGTVVYSNEYGVIDASNTSDGYIMARYTGYSSKVKLRIIKGTTYTYDLSTSGGYEVFPLSLGSGTYTIQLLENISGNSYSLALSADVGASLSSQFAPFLRPNQFVNYNGSTSAVLKAASLSTGCSTDLQKLNQIYNFVINNFTYDYNKANTVQSGYVPNLNAVYSQRTGICFDYAAIMAAMLRSQNIPCKLVVGWAKSSPQSVYHAWINVYIRNVGWINGAIYFDGNSWKLMDPTFASTGKQSASIMSYINNTSNYSAVYYY